MKCIEEKLFALQDLKYRDFQASLLPNISKETCIGVRVPLLRKLAKELYRKEPELVQAFLEELPHRYHEENNLHAFLLEQIKDFSLCLEKTEIFLGYLDNWSSCDMFSPKCFAKERALLYRKARAWMQSEEEYRQRYGILCLQRYFLEEDFREEILAAVAEIESDHYYVKMMQAWFFATSLAKQWEKTLPYFVERRLATWIHKKSIQKAIESQRLTIEEKKILKGLR